MAESVLVERRGFAQLITINRPEVKNALDGATARALAAAVDELDATGDLRVGVLTGAGGSSPRMPGRAPRRSRRSGHRRGGDYER